MTKMDRLSTFSRRAVLKGAGAVVVSVGMPIGLDTVLAINSAFAQGARPPLVPDQLSSYIAINGDGSVAAFFGKMDMGQGLYVSIGQMVAEELDVPFERVKVHMADTRTSVNQGGASARPASSTAANRCAPPPPKPAACWWRWRRRSSGFP
jgi:CO/xanthine dehydrogenase Mo-binding subunit